MTALDPAVRRRRVLITITVMMATIMHALDGTIANVALPSIQGSLSATQEQVSWVVTSYIVASAILTPFAGFSATRFGLRPTLATCVIGFTAVSMLCGAAQTLDQLVLFRALQGGFGAALVPVSQAIMMDTFPREEQGKAMAMWGVGTMIGPIVGPSLGGWLTDEFSWRWVFYVNLPVGLLCTFGILALVRDSAHDRRRPFDMLGFAFLAIAIGSFQLMLDRGQQLDWFDSIEIVIEGLVAAVAFAMFLIHMLTGSHPFLSRDLFADRNLSVGLILTAITGLILIVTATLMPPFLQQLKGYPVFTTGVVLAPRGAGMMVAMMMVSRLIGRFDARYMITLGFMLCAWSLWEMTTFTLEVSESRIIWNGVALGFGLGLVFPPLTTLTFATLPPRLRTEGAAINALMRNLGASVGIAVLVSLLARSTQANRAELVGQLTPYSAGWPFGRVIPGPDSQMLAAWDAEINRQAAMIGYLNDFRAMTLCTLVVIPLLFFMRKPMLAR
ncbi:MAG: DHA2 family efflux MFS transporter permease subunit [Alphaproteobacteria bacterium]|nr:DHA2 family efflux MFS transporter permease subunit [Alphaproteobacteria bacterium]